MERVEELRRRLETALKPASRPSVEEVLQHVSRRGVLRGPVDWVFPAWIVYVEYAVQEIVEEFPLVMEERRQLLHFGATLKKLLHQAWGQTKTKLTSIYNAVLEGNYRIEGNKLCIIDGTWLRNAVVPYLTIRGVSASTWFPDILKLPRERLEMFQMGWRVSDEGENHGRPIMSTTQPWQIFAWTSVRYGKLHISIN